MKQKQHSLSSIEKYHSKPHKCCGLGCNNTGKYELKIMWIRKSGWFCPNCAVDIEKSGLVYNHEK